ncbi:MAG: sigma 54-interacting transcriptional regulator [Spirochaetaceae bacterium]|nr:sigma 54-interacting transcriptional regulator [Spirochaetaceae bacterium]
MLSTIDTKKFNLLIETISLVNSHHEDARSLLNRILGAVLEALDGEAAYLFLISGNGRELHAEAAAGAADAASDAKRAVKIGEGIPGWAAAHNKPLLVNDVENDRREKRKTASFHGGREIKTMLAVPLRFRDRCAGVITVLNRNGGKLFTQDDLEWLEIFADQAALAVQSAEGLAPDGERAVYHENRRPEKTDFHTFVAKSQVMRELAEVADRYAKTDASVLIRGESGVGKEIFAEQIHARSGRRDGPFIRVNCAAIPDGLLESELFGHVKGAFTNAVGERRGRFEMAGGGTIFLDEIGDMPSALQAKLLRVLQQKTFEKVGSDETITVDVRIIAATNRDIERLVEEGGFRSDLYYRLNVLPLYVPPLRERADDIPELASFFLKNMIKKTGKKIEGFSEAAMEALIAARWTGNVRELQNTVERAAVMSGAGLLGPEDLFPALYTEKTFGGGGERNLKEAINAFKARYIQNVLEENNGNQTEAARALDIQRTYLSRLIKELGIARKDGNG